MTRIFDSVWFSLGATLVMAVCAVVPSGLFGRVICTIALVEWAFVAGINTAERLSLPQDASRRARSGK